MLSTEDLAVRTSEVGEELLGLIDELLGDAGSAFIVTRGGKLITNGTADAPVVFTSINATTDNVSNAMVIDRFRDCFAPTSMLLRVVGPG